MLAIYKRELKSYLHTFIGFLFMGVTLFFLGLYFTVYNLMYGYPYFSYVIQSVVFIFLISIPILTMKILAEERKNKTDQLILTAPISVGRIVIGKFMALSTIFAIPTAIICIYPLLLTRFGTVPLSDCYVSILAFFLYGETCIAIGLLISSFTESQVIAAVLGFIVLFIGYMMSSICGLISSTGNILTTILSCFDMYTPFSELLMGALNLQSIVYFITITILVLFLTTQSIQKRRYSVSVKSFRMGAYSIGMIVAAVALVAVVNVIVSKMPVNLTSIDLTSEKIYSITDQTKEFVKNMEEDVTIYVMVKEEAEDVTLGQTLERYEALSDYIKVEYVDPTINPEFHTQYTDGTVNTNSLIVVSSKRSKVIDAADIYESTMDYNTYSSYTTGYDGEGQITSALAYVTSDSMPKIYITEGHGEYTLSSTFSAALEKENVDYETINLMDYEEIPEDTAGLLINAPVKDFNTDDTEKVIKFLENGGNVIIITGYTNENRSNFNKILDYMGIGIADGLVVEQSKDHYYQSPFFILPEISSDTYTRGIYNQYYIFAPYAQGIMVPDEGTEGIEYTTFLSTSDSAFSKVSIENTEDYSKADGDLDGPFGIGVKATKELENGAASMVVISCEHVFTDSADQMVSGANQMLFSNIISGFADHEVSVSVPVKNYNATTLIIPESSIAAIGIVTTFVLPVGCLITGFIIWFRRRKK